MSVFLRLALVLRARSSLIERVIVDLFLSLLSFFALHLHRVGGASVFLFLCFSSFDFT